LLAADEITYVTVTGMRMSPHPQVTPTHHCAGSSCCFTIYL